MWSSSSPRRYALGGLALALLGPALVPSLRANNQCSHLGQAVICPPGITPGSNSVNFVGNGIFWSDGNTSVGTQVPLFVPMAPAGGGLTFGPRNFSSTSGTQQGRNGDPTPPGGRFGFGSSPMGGYGLGGAFSPGGVEGKPGERDLVTVDDLLDRLERTERLRKRYPPSPPPITRGPGWGRFGLLGRRTPAGDSPTEGSEGSEPAGDPPPPDSDPSPVIKGPMITLDPSKIPLPPPGALSQGMGSGFEASTAVISGQTVILPDLRSTLPGYVTGEAAPAGSRAAIQKQFAGSGDIAGAAEALAREGAIRYDQSTQRQLMQDAKKNASIAGLSEKDYVDRARGHFVNMASPGQLLETTRGNCYEFVHLAGAFAGDGRLPQSSGGAKPLIDPSKMVKWDGSSEIPRGMIIIGTVSKAMGGQDGYGFFHVAVSLGEGKVANNRGHGVQIEKVGDVFGMFYTNPLWGKGIYYAPYDGYKLADGAKDFLEERRASLVAIRQTFRDNPEGEAEEGAGPLTEAQKEANRGTARVADRNLTRRIRLINSLLSTDGQGVEGLDAQDGKPLRPGEFNEDLKSYQDFLNQGIQGTSEGKPFFHEDYRRFPGARTDKFTGERLPGKGGGGSPAPKPARPRQSQAEFEKQASQFFLDAIGEADGQRAALPLIQP